MRKANLLPDHPTVSGWSAARMVLERCQLTARRELLASLTLSAGVVGAPALSYLAERLRWHADHASYPVPRKVLRAVDVEFIERRAREQIESVIDNPCLPPQIRGI